MRSGRGDLGGVERVGLLRRPDESGLAKTRNGCHREAPHEMWDVAITFTSPPHYFSSCAPNEGEMGADPQVPLCSEGCPASDL